ncbi:unnamed protein product [Mytilus coruscus]|uniref:Uncharacterized protein n=1 Tax=Mytilus coruscus TaxID=42192 RepID=A0A6J8BN68_MYTCO|nr:unnamed protein product [Mytilus coruscus]
MRDLAVRKIFLVGLIHVFNEEITEAAEGEVVEAEEADETDNLDLIVQNYFKILIKEEVQRPLMGYLGNAVTLLLYIGFVAGRKCEFENRCQCFFNTGKQDYKADCSNAHLTHIPDFPKNIKVIILDNNLISTIPDNHFRNNSKLCKISLLNNKLTVLRKDTFCGAYNLINLTLYNNEIKDVDENVFMSIPALKYLNIKRNHIDWMKLNITFPYSLQTLLMDFKILEQNHIFDSFKGLINKVCVTVNICQSIDTSF